MAERKKRVQKTSTQVKAKSAAPVEKAAAAPAQEEFNVFITELDQYLFGHGVHYDIFRKLGAHETTKDGQEGVYFAVWAPHAQQVNVIGSFNGWNEESHTMTRLEPLGIFELFVPEAKQGDLYKYLILTKKGEKLYKADPFANQAEKRPGTASVVADIRHLKWTDDKWMKKQETYVPEESPIAIYEVHPGSWMRHPHGEEEDGFYNYRLFAERCTELTERFAEMSESDGCKVSASIGAAFFPDDGRSFTELYAAGDKALYSSKKHGKARFSFYDETEKEGGGVS